MKKILILAAILYTLLGAVTYHPDTKLTLRYPALESGQVWDIYRYTNEHVLNIPNFHYPPAHFWWLKIHYPIAKLLGGVGFDKWLESGSVEASYYLESWRYNLAVKMPLLLLGLACGWLIYGIIKKSGFGESESRGGVLIWLFNPVTLYALVAMGQNDIVAIFLFLLGWYFWKKWYLALPFWALAAGVKSYPLIWTMLFLVVAEKKLPRLVAKALVIVMGYVLILLPWLSKPYFWADVMNSGLSQRMFLANIPIGFDKEVVLIPLLLVILAVKFFGKKNKVKNIALVLIIGSLLILGFSHFNPQWLLWLLPFVAIKWAVNGITGSELMAAILVLGCWIILILGFDDKFLSWGLVGPINPDLINYPTLVQLAKNRNVSLKGVINLAQSALAGVGLALIFVKSKKGFKLKPVLLAKNLVFLPWILLALLVGMVGVIKVDRKVGISKGDEVLQVARIDKEWTYLANRGLRYVEISLNNPGSLSKDRAVLLIKNEKGQQLRKEFSGYNAVDDSWLRVDIPASMSDSRVITLSVEQLERQDGLLTISLDENGKWAINQYFRGYTSSKDIMNKLVFSWWIWVGAVILSIWYYRNAQKN
ncbi:hypothetical protein A2410_01295 [Candidatus Shapirobacteria bacterium RIFOXYC1_FULL_38_24]|uniref:Uncharacterized protein n=4 Tax=Patescibacteria group TaxID=1783273 RepID=A0A0G0JTJ8_9BACT|nr:MAG: hypothetical protein US90_C0005G0027 [Candidatus Shapirobacteria bacterium GW2011_GWE2_38_30]KKQ92607.1 MAG: hypothetical protein UT14_C0004G0006 [Candidatus Shapirobacteria bacterium GW2011_GWE1_38_92]OGJ05599.1 MAG: hypothetical protein A2192_00175 [Candidatus Nomurabacteria bacterium RIFOXYA1_FULL_35_17]OGL57161.1 MAG: hypothetical protein A2367_01115 [Candidatus Shapirobacteria bacterium RIFOXYB1_FULL_38_38]OGL57907.1 MAG: hypothetical protein A2410_01295 [Candidatus Shapirobacteria